MGNRWASPSGSVHRRLSPRNSHERSDDKRKEPPYLGGSFVCAARASGLNSISSRDTSEHSDAVPICDNEQQFFMPINRLRKFRKTAHLTQREVATLVGYASQRAYSDMELGLKRPGLGTALACCILFKTSLAELFPDLAEYVERTLLARARKVQEALEADASRDMAASHIAKIIRDLDK